MVMIKPIWMYLVTTIILSVVLCGSSICIADESHWPGSINRPTGFHDLGDAMRLDPDFPLHGSDVVKARYIFSRLPEIANKYDLKTGTGKPISSTVIGLMRLG